MLFVVLVAIYGSLTAAKKIILIQGLPAFLALIFLIL
jgi:putative membrane protein